MYETEAEGSAAERYAMENVRQLKIILKGFLERDLCEVPSKEEVKFEETQVLNLQKIIGVKYQEYAYLLDPYWDELIVPPIEALRNDIRSQATPTSSSGKNPSSSSIPSKKKHPLNAERTSALSMVIYEFIKCRGYKTIIRYFPHTTSDLSVILSFCDPLPHSKGDTDLAHPENELGLYDQPRLWTLRYVMLLWLSLVCMIPFDLRRFDSVDGRAAERIEKLGKGALGSSGLEREAGALVLARLYSRKDCLHMMASFLDDFDAVLEDDQDIFWVLGSLRVMLHLTRAIEYGPESALKRTIDRVVGKLEGCPTLMANSIVRKYRLKLAARSGVSMLGKGYRRLTRRTLTAGSDANTMDDEEEDEEEEDVPEDIEGTIDTLLPELEDKDTTVRWSASKSLARLSERLPQPLADQVLDAILRVFSIHSALSDDELPALAEPSWHGGCLALAEMARRGLIRGAKLAEVVGCLKRALYFDIRKGSHSIGSSVRDAACYVTWSLVRSTPPKLLEPFAKGMATSLMTISVLDREVHIRRAASAAFQEGVGRTSLFPHGIDLLRKADFYAVSIRRNAFIAVAPEVAQFDEYRDSLVEHLLNKTIKHWDVDVRTLGAKSLREIIGRDLESLAPPLVPRITSNMGSKDTNEVHGSLLYLAEIAGEVRASGLEGTPALKSLRTEIFNAIKALPPTLIQKHRHELIMEASCKVLQNAFSPVNLSSGDGEKSTEPWRRIVDTGLRHRIFTCQEAAAEVYGDLRSGDTSLQRSMIYAIGALRYDLRPGLAQGAISVLSQMFEKKDKDYVRSIDVRKASVDSLARILGCLGCRAVELDAGASRGVVQVLIDELDDYSVDQRGDVGSWVRMSCVSGLASISKMLLETFPSPGDLEKYLPPELFHIAIGGILKQGVERLDNVRQLVGETLTGLASTTRMLGDGLSPWRLCGMEILEPLLTNERGDHEWREASWLYPHAVRLLDIQQYRRQSLLGLILSIGSRTTATQHSAAESLQNWADDLPLTSTNESAGFLLVLRETFEVYIQAGIKHQMDIAALRTLEVLLKCDSTRQLTRVPEGSKLMDGIIERLIRVVDKLKSLERVEAVMKLAMVILPNPDFGAKSLPLLSLLLTHRFPKVRTETAEALYVVLETEDFEFDTEEITEELTSIEWNGDEAAKAAAERVVQDLAAAFASPTSAD